MMIEIIKEIGIFIVAAQAVLYFVPGEHYDKYVKVIIGIIMIVRITQPVLTLATGDVLEEIVEQSVTLMDMPEFVTGERETEYSKNTILFEIEEELKIRLDENPLDGYQVLAVSVEEDQSGQMQGIVVTVSKTKEKENTKITIEKITIDEEEMGTMDTGKQETERLREYYGTVLAVPLEKIEIRMK